VQLAVAIALSSQRFQSSPALKDRCNVG